MIPFTRVVLVLTLALSCARNPELFQWTERTRVAERQLETGRYQLAQREFAALEKSALSDHDRAYARMRQAESLRRAGQYAEAEVMLWELLRVGKTLSSEQRAKIGYKHGRVVIDGGDTGRGEALLKSLTRLYPNTIFGHRAFTFLRGRLRPRDPKKFVQWCQSSYQTAPDSELADNFIYEAARVAFDKNTAAADTHAAELLSKIIQKWHFENSALWDDAIWDLSLIHHRRGRYVKEIHFLNQLLSTREFTVWLGSYEIRNYKHAALRIGRVYYVDLQDYAMAARVFAAFHKDFSESRFQDDALWWLGHSLLKQGKSEAAASAFSQLVQDFPDSKFARRVRDGKPGP